MKRERTVIVISAVVALVLIAGVAWAAERGSRPAEQAGTHSSPSAVSSPHATSAAVEQTPASGTPAAVAAEPSPGPTQAASPQSEASSGGGQVATTPTSAPSPTPKPVVVAASPKPTPEPTKTRRPTPTPKPTAATVPAAAHFVVQGKIAKKTYFTLKQLEKLRTFSDDYFSRGKEPPEATTAFVGVRLTDILKAAGLKKDATRVTILAADDYSASFSLRQVQAAYIDETRPGVTLPMIIAYSEDGVAYIGDHPFRLVMGQAVEGDYNRQYWVKIVVSITVL